MTHAYVVVDAFSDVPLGGNPAAVVFGADTLEPAGMQRIAREMNLSETVFVLRPDGDADARVRIFTPVNELPFAGHPFLAAGLALSRSHCREHLEVETWMGTWPLDVRFGATLDTAAVGMRQPIPSWEPYPTEHLLAALGLGELGVSGSTVPVEAYRNGPRHVLVGLPDVETLSAVSPDHRALAEHLDMSAICFAPDGDGWRCRMFSPAYGVVEDPATGSGAGPLAIHVARHGLDRFDRDVRIVQGVEIGRRSVMTAHVETAGGAIAGVRVGGDAALCAEGRLLV